MPCLAEDPLWNLSNEELRRRAWRALQQVNPIEEGEVLRFSVRKLPFAYPVLEAADKSGGGVPSPMPPGSTPVG